MNDNGLRNAAEFFDETTSGPRLRRSIRSVIGRASDAVSDVSLLMEIEARGGRLTQIDPYGEVVVDAGPMIVFEYQGRVCAVERREDRDWEVHVDYRIDDYENGDVTRVVRRVGRPAEEAIAEVFTAIDALIPEAVALDRQG